MNEMTKDNNHLFSNIKIKKRKIVLPVFKFNSFNSIKLLKFRELFFHGLLALSASLSVIISIGIISILIIESIPFFQEVSFREFFLSTNWSPLFDNPSYGILPLLSGTFLTALLAMIIAVPMGTILAIYLSEYCSDKSREFLKPLLEILSSIPTVVYGYFTFMLVTPLLQKFIPELSGFNALSAGIVMGLMIIPYVTSLSEDALRSVPMNLREGSMSLGATKLQTCLQVVLPHASSGVVTSYILAFSRAIGETMIVTISCGLQPNLTMNPLQPTQTITAYIAQVSMGDLPHGSIGYQSIFVCGLSLFLLTFTLNSLSLYLKKKLMKNE